jgi:hypothetical protein
MSEILIKSGTPTELKFNVAVEGADAPVSEVRFTVPLKHELKLSYQGNVLGESVDFNVEGLEKHLSKGIHDFFLEVFVGNHYFVPYSGKLKLEEQLMVKADLKSEPIQRAKPIPSVSVSQKGTSITVKSEPVFRKAKTIEKSKPKKKSLVIKSINEAWEDMER